MAKLRIHPEYRALLQANSLATFAALWAAAEHEPVDGHRLRGVSRVELHDAGGRTVVLYIKRMWGPAATRSWKDLLRLRRPMLPAKREWVNTARLLAADVPAAPAVAWGRRSASGRPESFIVFREVRGPSLASLIRKASTGQDAPPPRLRRAIAEAIGRAVRRLHDRGFSFPDLYAKHVYLENLAGGDPRVVLIDVARLRRFLPHRAVEDLAALLVTTRAGAVGRTDRVRMLRAYLGDQRLGARACGLIGQIQQRAAAMPDRGQDPNLLETRRAAGAEADDEPMRHVDAGRLQIKESFVPVLEAAGLATLDALMAYAGGEPYRVVPGRSTVRVAFPDPGGGERVLYIKRYSHVPLRVQLRRTLSLNPPESFARLEARGIVRLADAGIPTARLVAHGEELPARGRRERSCLLTEEIAGATQADDWCEAAFAGPPTHEKTAEKRRFIATLARLARRFYAARLAHKDFYLCHFLVRPVAGGEPVIFLIDLQRLVRHRRRLPERWRVKDLAALLFSSWPSPATGIRSPIFTQTDRVRFAREYFGVPRLGTDEKRIIRGVVAKAHGIEAREARRRARREGSA